MMREPIVPPGLELPLEDEPRSSRLGFLEIDDSDRTRLVELRDVLAPRMEELLDEWHGFLLSRPETKDLLARGRVQQHLKVVQARYFLSLMTGPENREYFEERLRIGSIHRIVGLEPAWYTGAYRKFTDIVRKYLYSRGLGEGLIISWLASLEKVIYLDMQLALDAYFAAWSQELLDANRALVGMAEKLEVRNRELSSQYARAQEAAKIKEEFLSRISHELRTPLNSVLGYADLLADGIDGPVNEDQARSLEKIRRHGERLLGMIDRMIDAARFAAAGVSEPRVFKPDSLLGRVKAWGESLARAKGLTFQFETADELPAVRGDEEGLELAIRQLLENAFKFTHTGAVRLHVGRVGEDALRFAVSDAGPGISKEHVDRIFEPFYQVDFGDTRAVTGLGMGLTLARQAVERMGGVLALVSSGPTGSTFAADLPIASNQDQVVPFDEEK